MWGALSVEVSHGLDSVRIHELDSVRIHGLVSLRIHGLDSVRNDVIGCFCVVLVSRYWSVQMTVWWLIARLKE